jgi:hypothetical protein
MSGNPRHRFFLLLGGAVLLLHLVLAATLRSSFALTIFGDSLSCFFLILAILGFLENTREDSGILPLFWKLMTTGLFLLFLSESYWLYYDSLRRFSSPTPVPGDSLFLLGHIFFLFALALRPQSAAAGRNLHLRWLDFALLTCWWFTLYGYFCYPWQSIIRDFHKYNPGYYLLALILHLVIIASAAILRQRNAGPWRAFYTHLLIAFVLIGGGFLLLSVAIDRGYYYAGSFFDTPFFLALYWLSYIASLGSTLQAREDTRPNREVNQGIWTARVAMFAILSLPVLALIGYSKQQVIPAISMFRLRLIFGAMFCLAALLFWKLHLLSRQLIELVQLTRASIENLRSVQDRVAHSQKLSALGRLAAGATHEISNPLTAILGYSELLADIPSLSPEDRECAQGIQKQVHFAQGAVNSLRNKLRSSPSPHISLGEKPAEDIS